MEFRQIEDDRENYISGRFIITLPDGRDFEVFLLTNLYTVSVVGMYSGAGLYEFNWCCGDSEIVILTTHGFVRKLIEVGMPIRDFRAGSYIKPWPKDPDFSAWIKCQTDKYFFDG